MVVSPGLAINQEGEELVLCERATSDLCLGKEVCYVTLRLVERPTNVDAGGEASRIEESAEIAVVEDVAPGRPRDRSARARWRHLAARRQL